MSSDEGTGNHVEPTDRTETGLVLSSSLEDEFSHDTLIRAARTDVSSEETFPRGTPGSAQKEPSWSVEYLRDSTGSGPSVGVLPHLRATDEGHEHTLLDARAPADRLRPSPAVLTLAPVTPHDTNDPLIGTFLGDYRVDERIGHGGMGIVYKGCQPRIGKPVAIKVLRREVAQDPEHVERLLAEARAVNAIHHRGIIDIFGFGELPSGQPYVVMELLDGVSLDRVIAERAPMPAGEVVVLLEDLLAGLGAAHAAGVIHRDLKPNNLFVVEQPDGSRYVKILDFGLSKKGTTPYAATPQTRLNAVVGTPEYMAPEQARALAVSPQTDLYSLGVVLFEMLTGKLPFEGPSAIELLMKHVETPAPRVSSRVRNVPPELDNLVARLLEKSPDSRPASAEAMGKEVRRLRMRLSSADTQVRPLPDIDAEPIRPEKSSEGRRITAERLRSSPPKPQFHNMETPSERIDSSEVLASPEERTRTSRDAPIQLGFIHSWRSGFLDWEWPRRLMLGAAAGGVVVVVGFALMLSHDDEQRSAQPVLALPAAPAAELGSVMPESHVTKKPRASEPPASIEDVLSRAALLGRIARLEKSLNARLGSSVGPNHEALTSLAFQRNQAELAKDRDARTRIARALDEWEARFLSR